MRDKKNFIEGKKALWKIASVVYIQGENGSAAKRQTKYRSLLLQTKFSIQIQICRGSSVLSAHYEHRCVLHEPNKSMLACMRSPLFLILA